MAAKIMGLPGGDRLFHYFLYLSDVPISFYALNLLIFLQNILWGLFLMKGLFIVSLHLQRMRMNDRLPIEEQDI